MLTDLIDTVSVEGPRHALKFGGDAAMIVEMVRQGLGVSILSRWAVEPALRTPGLVVKRLTGKGLPTTWQAVTRANELKDSAAVQVAGQLAEWCEESLPRLLLQRSSAAAGFKA